MKKTNENKLAKKFGKVAKAKFGEPGFSMLSQSDQRKLITREFALHIGDTAIADRILFDLVEKNFIEMFITDFLRFIVERDVAGKCLKADSPFWQQFNGKRTFFPVPVGEIKIDFIKIVFNTTEESMLNNYLEQTFGVADDTFKRIATRILYGKPEDIFRNFTYVMNLKYLKNENIKIKN